MTEVERALLELRMEAAASRACLVALFQEVVRSGAVPRERVREVLRRIPRDLLPADETEDAQPDAAVAHYAEALDRLGGRILSAVERARPR